MIDISIFEVLPRAVMVGVTASITVGPIAILCIQRTLSKSQFSGYYSAAGIVAADTILATIAYLFYSIVKSYIEQYSDILGFVSSIIIFMIGIYILFLNPLPQIRKNRAGKGSSWSDFISIFGLTLANSVFITPYILIFFTMFNIVPIEEFTLESVLGGVIVIFGFLLGAILWWGSLITYVSRFRSRFRPRHLVVINRVTGSVISALGLIALVTILIKYMPNEF